LAYLGNEKVVIQVICYCAHEHLVTIFFIFLGLHLAIEREILVF